MNNEIVSVNAREVLDRALDALDESYTLGYVAYDDRLGDEQLTEVLDGKIDEVEDKIYDWFHENDHYAVDEIVKQVVPDEFERAALRRSGLIDELTGAIRERDDTDSLFKDLLRNTHSKLMRFHLGDPDADQDLEYASGSVAGDAGETNYIETNARRLAEMAGIDFAIDANAQAFRQMVAEQSWYGGQLYVIWYGDVDEVVKAAIDHANDLANEVPPRPFTIKWKDPEILLLDRYNGSGYGERVVGEVTATFELDRISLDKDGRGYGWDEVAGVVHSAYKCDVEITPRPGVERMIDTPVPPVAERRPETFGLER